MSDNVKPDNRTHAQKRMAERQAAMREFLMARGYVEQIETDLGRDLSEAELPQVKFKTETRLRLLQKVLPDLKAVEVTGEAGGPLRLYLAGADASL